MDMESTTGQTVEDMKDTGRMESSTVRGNIYCQTV